MNSQKKINTPRPADTQNKTVSLPQNKILITCARGLIDWLQQEVQELGYCIDSSHETGIEITASLHDAMKLNLCLRTAFNVLYLLKSFDAQTADEVYQHTVSFPWETLISTQEYISVVSRVNTRAINNPLFVNQKVKDAIVDRISQQCGKRPNSGAQRDNIVLYLYWNDNRCWLYLNTSGRKLSDRGYRKIPMKAPLQETLASGILFACGYNGTQSLINPMCGSGTLAIEAALMALNRMPGMLRDNFGFMHVKNFDAPLFQKLREELKRKNYNRLRAPIIAGDIDGRAVRAAQKNARDAGVDRFIEFHVGDFEKTPLPSQKGIIIMNPPYGERLGETSFLEKTYKRIGDFFKQKCSGHTGYIFTGNPHLAKTVGLRTSQRLVFFNAHIECRLLKYTLYAGSKKESTHKTKEEKDHHEQHT